MFKVFGAQRRQQAPVVPLLISLNVGVYLLWVFFGNEQYDNFVAQNFLVSWASLMDGRVWTLLTSAFSHNLLWHLLLNMFVLSSFGPIVEMTLGSKRFLKFYLFAGGLSSLGHAVVSAWFLNQPDMPALGASGAISGVIFFFALTYPRKKILIFGLIPVPALLGALAIVGLDVWGLIAQAEGGGLPIGHGAHLGGAFAGLLYFLHLRSEANRPRINY